MPPQRRYATARYNLNEPKQWICDSIGYETDNDKNNSEYWRPGKSNYADYWTKHHPATHHKHTSKEFLTPHIVLEMLRIEQSRAVAETTRNNRVAAAAA